MRGHTVPEIWVLKELAKALDVTLPVDVRQVRHHMSHNLEACVLRKPEALLHALNSVAPIRVASHVLVDALNAHLDTRAPVR